MNIKKITLGIVLAFLMAMPSVLAEITFYESFDLFGLFVENIFGNLVVASFGIAILLFILCMLSRMSMPLIIAIMVCYGIAMGVGSLGELFMLIAFIFFAFWSTRGIIKALTSRYT